MRYLLLFFVLVGCHPDNHFAIEGNLPDKQYDGENMYLAPMENYSLDRVDSALITNGHFKFEGVADEAELFVLRAKPILRLRLQELLVVKESGKIVVKLDEISSASGTPLNDSIQKWKVAKIRFEKNYSEFSEQYQRADSSTRTLIKHRADSAFLKDIDFHFNFVKNNRDNVVGKMILRIMGGSFSKEQKKELGIY